jgi:hypothetical protein
MPGASEQTRRVKVLNANWVAGPDGDDGRFELLIVTDDDQQHTLAPSPAAMTALVALSQVRWQYIMHGRVGLKCQWRNDCLVNMAVPAQRFC